MMSADVMSAAGAEALMGEQSLIEETAPVEIVAEQEEEAVLAEIDSESKEIAFIDTSVTDHETMVKDLKKEVDAGRNLEIVLIDSESDGIARITETLAEYDDLDAVHIYSHGSDGQIRLGDSWIDQTTLSENPETANAWGESLSEDADILIYGCDLASTEVGEQFVDKLAQLTGADITASDDMTGSATFGGDWDLEYAHGQIETETLFDEDTDLTWSGLLAAPTAANNTVTTNEDTTYTFTASDFNYSDGDGDAMSSIEITTLESVGSLQLSGIDVTINQVITKADIDAGNLTFVPVTAQNGSGYDSFGFSVNDGSLDSVSSYTMTLDVTAVNDASSFSSTTFSANTITTGADGANSVTAVDMDGDGDMDLLSASSNDNTIAWYENDGSGSFTEHNITTSAIRAVSVTTADMDGDGDMDVISNTSWGGKIDWYENDGSENFTAHTIDTFSTAAVVDGSVHVADVDGDGDLDVLAATANSTQIAWYENDGSENFTSHYITTSSRGFFTLTTADVDGDGDLDVVSASNDYAGKIDWYENDGSENFTAHTIDTYSTGADVGSVHVADVDDDGDLDLLLATYTDDKIIWYENDGSENFTTHTITSSADGASSVTTADVDGDGDLDILSASKLDDKIVWYENDGSENFSTNTITTGADGALSVIAADMDGDGDLDVISASYNDDTIRWYENTAVSTLDGAPSFTEGGSAVVLDANVEISDTELDASGNYSGASLTLVRNGGTNASDQFSETGTLSALTESGNLVVGGTTIGTVTTNSGGTLVLTFNSNATRALVNSAMQQIAYSNSSDAPSSSAQINWSFDDGNSGSQGTGGALQATGSTTVSITAVNDVPTASNNTVTTNEDTTYTLTASDFNFTDVDGDTMASIKVTTLETVGALQLSGVDVTLNQVITKANIDSGNLKFVPVANANGSSYDSFAFSVNDGTADSASSYTLTVDVTAVNDAPTAANNTVTTNEDTTYTFTASDFSFSDIEGSTMASIKVTTLETAGSLQLSGVDVTLNQVITKADIDAGNLKFVPVANANGSSYDSFAFSVNDGTADSASSYTLTVDVTAVNDAPTITNLASDALNYTEGDRTVVIEQGADVIVTDVDLTDFDTGTLTVSFTGVGSDQEEDILAIRNQGYGTGEISIAGYGVAYEGTLIGSFTGGANGVDLVITFNANANAVAVEALIENITYENSDNDNPTIGARTVRFVLNDGDGDTSANYDTTVNVSAANDAPTFLIGDGIVTTGTDSVKEFARSVTVQDDGQILVAGINDNGSFVVNRYNQNGSLDTTFGTEGTVTTLVGPSNSGVGADLIVQADGKIVVTGWTSNASTEDFILVRYNANGTLDDTFDGDTGNGNGIVTTDFSGTVDYSYSVVVQADGKIVVGGISNTSAALTRYNTDGTLDTDFGGGDGKVTFAGDMSTLKSIALQSDGKIVMAGYGEGVSNKDFMLMRSNTDGTLDTDFGTNGITITPMAAGHDYIHDVMVLDDGRILVAGEANYDFALALYDSNGDLDTSFGGGDGKVTTAFSAGVDGGYSVTVQDDGMVLVAGYSNSHNGFVLFRFDANGAEDTSFGTNGLVTTDIGSVSLNDKAYSVTVQSDGKILVAGDDFIDSNNTNFTLVRYNADGSLDTTFDAVNTLDGTPTYTEGGSAVVLDSNVQISDTELDALGNYNGASLTLVRNGGANASDQYSETGTLSALTESGNLVVGGTTIGTVTTNSGGTLVLTFNSSATSTLINSAMQQIAYSNSSDAPSSSVQIDWSFDDGNSGSQGTGGALQATGSTTVSITAVNDVPTASANTVTTNEDTTYTFTASDFSFSDVDGDTMASIKVTTLETVGALQLSGVDVTLNQVITKANIDSGNLKFVPVANANGSSYDSFAFSVNDGTTDSASSYTLTIDVTAVNDEPTLSATGSDPTFTEGDSAVSLFSGTAVSTVESGQTITGLTFTVTNVTDTGNEQITIDGATITLDDSESGSTTDFSYSVSVSGTTATVTLSGGTASTANVVSDIDNATYINNSQDPTNANRVVMITAVVDSGGTSNGGDNTGTPVATSTVDVDAVNDAPTASANTVTTNEDTTYTFTASDFNFSDVDGDTLASIKVTTLETVGALQLSGVDVTLNQVITKADIDAGNLKFVPVANANGSSYDSFAFSVNDGTTDSASSYTLTVDVTAVNDAPTAAANTVTTNEDTTYTFSASDFSYSDIDSDTMASIEITTLESTGALQLSGVDVTLNQVITKADIDAGNLKFVPVANANGSSYDSFAFSVNDGTTDSASSYTLTVDVTAVNDAPTAAANTVTTNEDTTYTFSASDFSYSDTEGSTMASIEITTLETAGALQLSGADVTLNQVITKADIDAGNLKFVPVANANGSSYDSFAFSVNDGTTDSASSYTLTVDVTAVNDAPTAAANTVTTNEDTTYTFSASDFSYSDIDSDTMASVKITTLETAGALQLSGADVTLNQVITKADIDAGNLKFVPVANANGSSYDSFAFSVNDGTTDSASSYTLTVDVTAVNDAPTAASNTVTTNEDTTYTFSASDFSYSDIDSDTMASVKITTLETVGSLQLSGADVTINQVITKADIDAGNLKFVPVANANGSSYDSFAFSVNDGTTDSASSYTLTVDVTAVNDAPTADANTVTTNEDTTYTFSASDFSYSDIDSDTMASVKITTLETAGALQLSGADVTINQVITKADIDAGNLKFVPAANANGSSYDSFAFSVNDGTTDSASSYTLTVDVTAVNDAPTAANNTVTTTEDTTYTFSASDFSYSDIDSDTMASIEITTLESTGALQLSGVDVTLNQVITKADIDAGNLKFVPAANANGSSYDSFAFSVNDGTTDSASSYTLTVDVTAVNDAPTAANNTVTTNEDTTYTFSASDFSYSDTEGSTMASIEITTLETAGALQLSGADVTLNQVITKADIDAGNLKFVPAANANGSSYDSFAFSVNDGTTDSASSYTLTVDVTAVNDAPTAASNTVTTNEDTTYTFSASDFSYSDIDSDTMASVKITTLETVGSLQLSGADVTINQVITKADIDAGNLKFVPVANANGSSYDSFAFSVNDGTTDSASSYTLTVDVTAVNDAPTAANNTVTTTEDTTYTFSASDFSYSDIDSDTMASIEITTLESTGALQLSGADVTINQVITKADIDAGNLKFVPVANANGSSYDSFAFSVNDGTTDSASSYTLTVDVTAVNDAPTAANNTITTNEDTTYTFSASDFSYSDIDSDTLASVKITTLETVGALQLSGADVTLNQVITKADIDAGNLKFVPVANANGSSYDSFAFSVNDGTTDSASSYTLTVDVTAVNDAPTADANTVTTNEDTTYTFSASDFSYSDIDSDTMASVKITTLETAGALQLSGVDVTLNQVITKADIDAGNLKFVPVANANGSSYDSFAFSVNDGTTDSASSYTLTVDVTAVNDAPTAANNTITTNEDTTYTFSASDFSYSDIDSDTMASIEITTLETAGALQLSGADVTLNQVITKADIDAGNLKFVPVANANGSSYDSFAFSVNDGTTDSASSYTLTVDVTAVNDAPTAAANTVTTNEDTTYTFSASDFSYSDIDSDTMASVKITTLETAGALQLSGADVTLNQVITKADIDAGNLKFVPVANANGSSYDSFAFSVNDGTTDSASSYTLTVDVTAVNDAPTAAANTVTTNEDTTYTFSASDFSYSDIDSDTMASVKITTLETAGALQLSGVDVTLNQVITKADIDAGNLKFIPVANANGSSYDSFAFSVNDGTTDSASSYTLTVDVTAVNDAPTAANNTVTTNEDTTYTFSASDFSYSDTEGSTMASIEITTLETAGALQLSGADVTINQVITKADIDAGNLKFVPVANANGSSYDSFAFSVNDGTTDSASSYTLTVDVTAVNDAPTAAANTVTTNEDTTYTFSASDFSYSDIDSDTMASVKITTLETVGSLQLSGSNVTLNQVITKADIDAGNLKFVPVANANGSSYDSFAFSVNDGTTDSASSYTLTVDVTAVNDAPTAAANTVTTNEDTTYTFSASDFSYSDIDSDTMASVKITTLETAGALQLSGADVTLNQVITKADIDAGNLKFVPVANANGSSYDSFAFSVNDGTTDSASSYTLTVDVTAVNDAPTAANNTITTNEDTTYTFSASDFSYSDIDSDTMASVKITTLETAGALQLSGADVTLNQVITKADIDAGNLKFVPVANANGSSYDSFAFSVNDSTTDSASSYTLTVDVTAVNDAPTAAANTVTTNEDTTYTFSASDFSYSDIDSDTMASVKITTLETAGALQLSGVDVTLNQVITKADIDAGNLKFVPVANANGSSYDSFAFSVNDGTTDSASSYTLTVDVTAVNDAPTAANNTITTNEDTTYTFSASDFSYSDIDSDTLASVKITTLETAGALQLSGVDVTLNQVITKADIDAGNLKFVPVANANGSSYDSFAFSVNDGTADSASSYTLTVDVTAVNDAPTAANNTVTTTEDTTYTFSASDFSYSDIDSDTMASIEITTLESTGALQLSGADVTINQVITKADIDAGNLKFVPVANANGSSYDSFAFSVNDGTTDSASSYTLTVDVTAVNDAPTAAANTVTTNEDTTYTFSASDFSYSDIDSDTMASIEITTLETAGALQLSGADVTLNQVITKADIDAGNLKFVPVANANGSSYDSFAFSVNDGTADSASSYTLTVDVTAVNDAPTAANNTVTTNEDTTYTFSASDFSYSDIDSDTMASVKITTLETVGSLQLSGVDVTLNQVITKADIDAGNLKFVPVANANGSSYDSFAFSVNDGSIDSTSSYTLTVDVTAVNDAPTAANNTVTTNEDTTYTFNASDFSYSDIDSDTMASIRITTLETVGSLQLSGVNVTLNQVITKADIDAGNLKFVPAANANGSSYDSFAFCVNDGTTDSASSYTLTVDVTAVNDAPTSANNTVTTNEDTTYTFTASDFIFSDTEGSTMASIKVTTLETAGALQLSGVDVTLNQVITKADIDAGNLKFVPVANANGSSYDSFAFSVNDGTADSTSSYTLTVDVTAVNDAPTASANTVTTNEDTTYTFTASDFSFNDVDGDTMASIKITTLESVGALQLSGVDVTLNQVISKANIDAGNLKFVPVANANGSSYDSFAFSVNDGTVDSASSYTLTVDVTAVNDAPTAAANTVTTTEDTTYTFSASDFSYSDIDSDTMASVKITTLESVGSLQLSGVDVTLNQVITKADIDAGNLKFVPAANANGSSYDSFAFSVNDGTTDSTSSYTLTVDVTAVNDAPTFMVGDGDGIVTTDLGSNDYGRSVTVQSDGKILVAGHSHNGTDNDFTLTRYNADGSLDTTFGGGDGIVTTDLGSNDYGRSMTVQSDGKILVTGSSHNGTDNDFALIRYNTDGSLDTTFGGGDGIVTTDLGSSNDSGRSIMIQSDGKILVAGDSDNGTDDKFALIRYNTDGSLDTSFGTSGIATTPIGSGDVFVESAVLQSDGKILLAGAGADVTRSQYDIVIVRFNTNGSLDTSFDTDGIVATPFSASHAVARSITVLSDGKILVAGDSIGDNYDFTLARYNADGSLDTSFDGDGILTTAIGAGHDIPMSITVQSDGKILLAGNSSNGTDDDFAMVRYNADGSLDTSFDGDGIVTTAIGAGRDHIRSITVQSDGKIVVTGHSHNGTNDDFALVRYNADGSLDTSFDSVNTLDGTPTFTEGGSAVVLDSNVQISDTELDALGNYNGASLTLVRNGGTNSKDQFSETGTLSALTASGNLVVGGTTIGTVTTNSGGTLVLTFNSSATSTLINSAMQQIAYSNSSDAPSASVQINWSFDDGNSGSQGTGGALQATGSATVSITAVNDAPTASANTVTTNEDTTYTFTASDFNFSDVDGDTLASIKVTTLETVGALQLSGVDVTLNQVITKANIDAGNLKFVPVANANGSSYDSFAFSVNDGTTDSASSYTLTVDVTAVNDAPTAAANTVTTTEDTTYTFSASDFSYSDIDSDTMASVKITTLETAGALQLSGVDVTLNQVISKADIDAGNLKFVPAANANGSGYDSFAFSVNDGTTDSASSYTLTVNVTAVEDPDSNGFYDDGASLLKFTDDDTDTKSHTKSKNSSNSNSNSRSHHKTHITNNEKVKAGKDAGHGIDEGIKTNSEKLPDGRLNALDKSSDKATDANRRHTQDSTDVDRDDMFSRNMFSKDSVSKADETYNETFDENESKKLYDDILNSWDKSSEMTTDAIRNHAQKPTNVDSNDMYSNHNKFRNEEEHNSTFDVNESAKLYDDILNSWHKHSDMTTDAIRNHTQGLSDVDSNVSNYNKFKTEEAYNETFDVNESKKLYDDTLNSWDKHSDLTSNSFWSTTHEPTDVDSNSTHGDMFSNKMFSNDSEFRIEEVNATNDVNEGENLNSEGPVLEFIDTVEESNTDRISDQDSDPSDESGSSQDQNESTENEDVVDDDSEKKDKVPTKGFFARLRNLVVSSK